MSEFEEFPKIARFSREVIVTEKIDGTNAQIFVGEDGKVRAGSRSRWIEPWDDNFGFARWVYENAEELRALGPGRHFGEWWGSGIQRGYGLQKGEKRFSLFNVSRWADRHTIPPEDANTTHVDLETMRWAPSCCHVVPVLWRGTFDDLLVREIVADLRLNGSRAAPGFMKPEGVIVFHLAANAGFKKTLEKDEVPKALAGKP